MPKQRKVRTYSVRIDLDGRQSQRLVVASSQAQARSHVTKASMKIHAVDGIEVVNLMQEGCIVEYADSDSDE